MNNKRIRLLLAGATACISFMFFITPTQGANIVIGGDYTDIGTIVVISPKPGDTPQVNGTALLNNLAAITADVNNRYLIKLGPGIYDVGTSSVQMKEYVDIEGSGENTTLIQGSLDSGTAGVVNGASFAEIRFLTIKNAGAGTNKIAMYNNAASPKVTNVTAIATGSSTSSGTAARAFTNISSALIMTNVTAEASGANGNVGIINSNSATPGVTMTNVRATAKPPAGSNNYAVYNVTASSPVVMTNVTAEASGASVYNLGVYNNQASAVLTTVTAKGTGSPTAYGVYSDNGTPTPVCTLCTVTIQNSMIMGSTAAIGRLNSAIKTRVAGSQLDGAVSGENVTCAGVYDEDYTFYASICP